MTGMKNCLSDEEKILRHNILFLLLYREDMTCYAIAKELGCKDSLVYSINKKYKIRNLKPTTKNYSKTRPDVENRVLDYLKNSSLPMSTIAKIFKVSPSYVKEIAHENHLRGTFDV